MTLAAGQNLVQEDQLFRKLGWRLIPLLFLCYVVSYLDRVNVAFAKLQMLQDLKFSNEVYGTGAGIFFIGYFLFEIPSNIILHKVGARIWIARIMITWGLISGAMVLVSSSTSFYILRFLLGLAEAGFFPGIILYLTYWFPARRRAKFVTLFMTAVPVSGIIGGPLSGWIMKQMPGVMGYAGWQWMFLIEAIPSVLLGIVVLVYLQDRIADAKWLTAPERDTLGKLMQVEESAKAAHGPIGMLANPKIWLMAAIYFCLVMGLYGISFWLPTLIQATGVKDAFDIGLLSALPYIAAMLIMVPVSLSSDKQSERRWHVAIPAALGGLGLVASTLFQGNTTLAMISLTVATVGIITSLPLFWSLPTAILGGTAAAAGIALINSLGNLAGYVSPTIVGWLKDKTADSATGMMVLAASLVLGAVLTLAVPKHLVNK